MTTNHFGRRLAAALLVFGVAASVSLVGIAAPAAAKQDDVLVSSDGVTFGTDIAKPLFSSVGPLVPGRADEATLWVKNPTNGPVAVRVSAKNVVIPQNAFSTNVTLSVWDSASGTSRSYPLSSLTECQVLVLPSQMLTDGQTVRVRFGFVLGNLPGNVATRESAKFDLLVAMRHGVGGSFSPSACKDSGVLISGNTNNLVNVGSVQKMDADSRDIVFLSVLAVAGLLFTSGLARGMVRRRRGRRRGSRES